MIRWFIEQRVLAHMINVIVFVGGIGALFLVPVEEFPNVSFDQAQITTRYRGASPEEVEREVTRVIEDEICDADGIKFIRSVSAAEISVIHVKFREDLPDFEAAFHTLETELDRVTGLPDAAEAPELSRIDVEEVNPVIIVVVGGGTGHDDRRLAADIVEDALLALPGVSSVKVQGRLDREVSVACDPFLLAGYDLTIEEVAAVLGNRIATLPGGRIDLADGASELILRGGSAVADLRSIEETIVRPAGPRGGAIRLADVATVRWDHEPEQVRARYLGAPAISIAVGKERRANALDIRDAVVAAIARIQAEHSLPAGIEIGLFGDTTIRIRDRLRTLLQNVAMGGVIVLLLMWPGLGFRNAFFAIWGVAFALVGTVLVLSATGESVNSISLFAMVLTSGLLVDDAIVVIENIYRKRQQGLPLDQAAKEGTSEVAWPVASAALTTVAAFLPLLLMSGVTGRFFQVIPKVVCLSLLISLFEALFILPAHVVDFGPRSIPADRPGPLSRFRGAYEALLRGAMRRRYLVLLGSGVAFAGALAVFYRIPVHFFPSEVQMFWVNIEMPPSASLDETTRLTDRVEAICRGAPADEVRDVVATAGFYFDFNYQPHIEPRYGQCLVTIAADGVRTVPVPEVIRRMRDRLARADLPGARIEVLEMNEGPPVGPPVALRIRGDDIDALRTIASDVEGILRAVPGVHDVRSDLRTGMDEARFAIDGDRAWRHGVTQGNLARLLAAANDGIICGVLRPGDETANVRVRALPAFRDSPATLADLACRTASGALVPVRDLARIEEGAGLAAIGRYQRARTVTLTADIDPAVATSSSVNRLLATRVPALLASRPGYRIDLGGEFEETTESFESLKLAFVIGMLLIYAILAVQFGSFTRPFIVLLTVPLSVIGVTLGALATGDPFTITSFIGLVGLAGVVVNDAIVLVSFIEDRRRETPGTPLADVVVEAGTTRLRAIYLTTATTVGGLSTMALGVGGRSPIWAPMATTIISGISFATLLTLVVVPCAYCVLEDVLGLVRRRARG